MFTASWCEEYISPDTMHLGKAIKEIEVVDLAFKEISDKWGEKNSCT